MTQHIYHITSRAAAEQARERGEYRTDSLATEGFIHFSQSFQLLRVANSFYTGMKDLVILVVDTQALTAELKFEPPVHPGGKAPASGTDTGALFPHLYGPLNFGAVVRMIDLPTGPDGLFELPALD